MITRLTKPTLTTMAVLITLLGTSLGVSAQDMAAPPNSLVVDNVGFVGIGTATPLANLEVKGNNGATKFQVTEASVTAQSRDLMILDNNGPPRFRLNNNALGVYWAFINNAQGNFTITDFEDAGSPRNEFNLDRVGNLTIDGTLTQNSDRTRKIDITAISPETILNKVMALPVSQWTYVGDAAGVHHFGPMAQDFHKQFGLGTDNRHIAPLDAAGVALAAIQGLHRQVQERDARIAQLEAQLQTQQARLAHLEQQQTKVELLAARLEMLLLGEAQAAR